MKVQIALVVLLALANAQIGGGWKKQNPTVFQATNSNIVNEAQQAVEAKYQPIEQGYEFEKVVSIETQVVAGTNYDVVLEYSNAEGETQQYDVIIYSAPWNGADQITKCDQISGQPTEFTASQSFTQVTDAPSQVSEKVIKPSTLGLRIRKQVMKDTVATGTWETINPDVFASSNDNVLQEAEQVVAQQYNPAAQGFEFDKVLKVQTQLVSGTNYSIELLYTNDNGQYQTYNVVLYICPWNPSANQEKATLTGEYTV